MKPYHDSECFKHKLITYVTDGFLVLFLYISVQLFISFFQDQKTFGFLEHTHIVFITLHRNNMLPGNLKIISNFCYTIRNFS